MINQSKRISSFVIIVLIVGLAVGAFFLLRDEEEETKINTAPNSVAASITDQSEKIEEILGNTETSVNNNKNTNTQIVNTNTTVKTKSAEQQRYEDLQEEHQQYNTALTDNLNAAAVAVMSSKWVEAKRYSQDAITIFQQWIEIDQDLIELANQLGLGSEAAVFSKRIEWNESNIEFYQKSIECADYAIAGDEQSQAACEIEIEEIYQKNFIIMQEYGALRYD